MDLQIADIECIFDSNSTSIHEPNLDLDDAKGKIFLKVLLNLIMHDYQPFSITCIILTFSTF